MFIESLIFWSVGYFFCYLTFYLRSKREIVTTENYPKSIAIFIIIILIEILFRFLIYYNRGI